MVNNLNWMAMTPRQIPYMSSMEIIGMATLTNTKLIKLIRAQKQHMEIYIEKH